MKLFFKQLPVALSLLLVFVTLAFLPKPVSKLYVSNYENVLGTSMEIKIAAGKEEIAARAENIALAEVDRLNKILSGYDATSEFSRWMKTDKKPVVVSAELFEVLSLFEQWRAKTNGALDASAETISKLWRSVAKQNRLPSSEETTNVIKEVHQQHYMLNEKDHTAQRITNSPLILNSFAKSYIMNKAADAALAMGEVSGIVLNIGGDIVVRGEHAERILVADPKADAENDAPLAQVQISNKTIATSGNYRRGVLINGKWYSHIVDPRTGQPAHEVISATVIANNATDAGALATALNVLSLQEGKELVASVPGAEYMLVTADGKQIESEGWKKMGLPKEQKDIPLISSDNKQKKWDDKYELAINVELATIEGMRVHRPFLAVWVQDEDKRPVRQIAVWFNKPRWLNDLRSWYAVYGEQFKAGDNNVSSTSSATRSPGKYTLKWDGKDDAGNLVKEGTYTVYVEAAREHGTHQLMSQAIDVKKQKHVDIAGNVEIASVSIDYQKKADGK